MASGLRRGSSAFLRRYDAGGERGATGGGGGPPGCLTLAHVALTDRAGASSRARVRESGEPPPTGARSLPRASALLAGLRRPGQLGKCLSLRLVSLKGPGVDTLPGYSPEKLVTAVRGTATGVRARSKCRTPALRGTNGFVSRTPSAPGSERGRRSLWNRGVGDAQFFLF